MVRKELRVNLTTLIAAAVWVPLYFALDLSGWQPPALLLEGFLIAGIGTLIVQDVALVLAALEYHVLDRALADEGKDSLRPTVPMGWYIVSALSLSTAALTAESMLWSRSVGNGSEMSLLFDGLVLASEVSAVVGLFAGDSYAKIIRGKDLLLRDSAGGISVSLPQRPSDTRMGQPSLRVSIPLLSIRY